MGLWFVVYQNGNVLKAELPSRTTTSLLSNFPVTIISWPGCPALRGLHPQTPWFWRATHMHDEARPDLKSSNDVVVPLVVLALALSFFSRKMGKERASHVATGCEP